VTERLTIGIDLGTTHAAFAVASTDEKERIDTRVLAVEQLVSTTTTQSRPLLPSFIYFAHEAEGALPLPWDSERTHAVGELARTRAAEAPGRVVSSAKSWLSHSGVDRRKDLLPPTPAEDVEKISPVEASFRVLDHLAEAWAHSKEGEGRPALADLDVVLTVPASFDAAARDLTVEAALAAGIEQITLLEEPQAALYAWVEHMGKDFRQHLTPGDVVLVIDVGGGTTDFSAIAVVENEGSIELRRIAVGDHILLGGDNMDLALAYHMKQKLEKDGTGLDKWQLLSLTHAARKAKETLLSEGDLDTVPVVVASRGSQLLGSTKRTELTRQEVTSLLVEGYFPIVPASAKPLVRPRTALQQLGLPYAADPAVTKHLSAFLTKQASAIVGLPSASTTSGPHPDSKLDGRPTLITGDEPVNSRPSAGGVAATPKTILCPTKVLFNGGVFKSTVFRDRVMSTLNEWLRAIGAEEARVLPGEDLDLAVARGAAYYGEVRRGKGLRIRGGTAHSYYVGIESPAPAVPGFEPPLLALCVAPFGMEEGSEPTTIEQELLAVVGEPVRFRFFGSTVRRDDLSGNLLEQWSDSELSELSPIEVVLPAEKRQSGDVVPVRLRASVTAIGTLLVEAIPLEPVLPDEKWKVELSVRKSEEDAA
jgi:hypothetical protein